MTSLAIFIFSRKIVRRMLESSANKSLLGDCSILEADDGSTALDVMRSEIECECPNPRGSIYYSILDSPGAWDRAHLSTEKEAGTRETSSGGMA